MTNRFPFLFSKKIRGRALIAAALILIVGGVLQLASIYGPVVVVETRYQFYRGIHAAFGVDHVAQLFIPNFEGAFDLRGRSKNQEYGIAIPKLRLDEPVVFNVDPNDKVAYTDALEKGIAHASSTSFPDTGGLGYYFAHSANQDFTSQFNAIFYLLGKLEKDDEVFIWHEGVRNEYTVTETVVTDPEDVSFLQKTYDAETIVLQTCWPPGTTQQRKLVFAERVE